ncbi:MAG: N-acetylmuramoyl-L-alanine amidase [Desulfotomaculum sp. 46_296]|nr:MAG: N-acetylmuramoyl-L-alanine amidase [Desulfotomaculum sp. 46_296]HAU32109.1 N-acetylmuramoyl-L-alanine amidase [Desulfotomaculum sp.]
MPVQKNIVVLDPGHGGYDPGAIGLNGTNESQVVLSIAKKAQLYLSSTVDVYLTRTEDKSLIRNPVADQIARAAMSNSINAACFVSIHCNSSKEKQDHGVETYYYTGSERGKLLAANINKRLSPAAGLLNRGIKEAELAVLRYAKCPSAQVEVAFITNPQEEALLKTDDFQDRAACAIASGIASFIGANLQRLPDFDYSYQETPFIKLIRKAKFTESCEKSEPVTIEILADILDKLGIL